MTIKTRKARPHRPGGHASPPFSVRGRIQAMENEIAQRFNRGDWPGAERIARRILMAEPNNAQALHCLGLAAHRLGKRERAHGLVQKSIERNPNVPTYHYNLGNILKDMDRREAAAQAFAKAIALDPGHVEAHNNLGVLLLDGGHPGWAETHLRKAIGLRPDYVSAHFSLAVALNRQARREEAAEVCGRILDLRPGDPRARHLLHSLRGGEPETAPKEYVASLFDGYAERFDEHLVQDLRYRAPQLLREAVGRMAGAEGASSWRVLDLGCGTGLCGPLFRPLARHLRGVDLSPKMIEKAREKNVYDELEEGDLRAALQAERGALDLALAADVLIYVGELEGVFEACGAALREGGLFAFTTESFDGEGCLLRSSGRFAHSPAYIEGLAKKNGLAVALREEIVPRMEGRSPIAGHLYVLRKGEAAPEAPTPEIAIEPGETSEIFQSALLHHEAGQLARAEDLYRRVLEREPEHEGALNGLGAIAHQAGHDEAAAELIARAIAKNPCAAPYHANLALALWGQGRTEEAEASLRRALALGPGDATAHNNLANLLLVGGRLEEAVGHYREAIALRPNHPQAHNNLAVALLGQERLEEAADHFRRAAELAPEYAEARLNLAKLLQIQGRPAEAAAHPRRLLKLAPGDAQARELLEECEAALPKTDA